MVHAKMMKAAVVEKFGEPLVVREVPVPTPDPDRHSLKCSRRAYVTPIFTQRTAIGRLSLRLHSLRAMKARESWLR